MKRGGERSAFGRWLRAVRLPAYTSAEKARAALNIPIAQSVYAQLESGSREPTAEQRAILTGIWGPFFDPEPTERALDPETREMLDAAVERAFDRLADRLIAFLDQRLPPRNGAPSET